jgi:hypothetical protein
MVRRTILLWACVAALLCALPGCRRAAVRPVPKTADELWAEKIKVMNELADVAERDAPQADFDRLGGRLGEIVKAEKALDQSDAEVFRLQEKHTPAMREAMRRLTAASARHPAVADKMTKIRYFDDAPAPRRTP